MVPKQPRLDGAQAEQLFQIVLGRIDAFLKTGRTDEVLDPVTLLNASRLMLVPSHAQSTGAYAALGMLHWTRYLRSTESQTDFDAACRFFSHVHIVAPDLLPDGLREQFAAHPMAPEPPWLIWLTHASALAEEFARDRGERLLDQAIALYEQSLAAAPADDRPMVEYGLGMALSRRFEVLRERDDLDAAIVSLQRAAYRTKLSGNEPDDDPGRARWFGLGSAVWTHFELTRSRDALEEALHIFRTVAERTPRDHPVRPGFLTALSGALVAKFEIDRDLAALRAALAAAESAVADALPEYEHRATLARNLESIRERYQLLAPLRNLPL